VEADTGRRIVGTIDAVLVILKTFVFQATCAGKEEGCQRHYDETYFAHDIRFYLI
jgi:hypothetical protein